MNREEILSHVDHTLLKPEATWPQIQVICDEAIANHTASICINTCYVKQAVEYLAGRIPVCCVVGFPLGAMDTESKAFEAKKAVENGASEGNVMIVNESINNYPQQVEFIRNDTGEQIYQSKAIPVGSKIERAKLDAALPAGTYECTAYFHNLDPESGEIIGTAGAIINITIKN